MTKRTRVQQACSARHDGELDARRAARLEADLQREPELESAADELAALDEALAAWAAPEPGEAFTGRLLTSLPAQSQAPATLWRQAWQPTMMAAVVAVALFCGGLVGDRLQRGTASLASAHSLAFDPLPLDSAPGQYVALMLQEDE